MAERRRLRLVLIALGALGGVAVPFVAHRGPNGAADGRLLGMTALAVLVNGAFGALTGWALGAFVDHFLGERS